MTRSSGSHDFRLHVPDPVEEAFDWHRRPGALPRLLAPWQPVRIGQESSDLRAGTTHLVFPGGRIWVAQHLPEQYVEGRRFVDRLESRPFVVPIAWRHQHDFAEDSGGTVLVDRVTTRLPAALLRPMFAYRHRQLADDLAAHRLTAGSPRLTVAVTGASGLVGGALVPFLTTGGHRVIRLVRRAPAAPGEVRWDPEAPDPATLEGVDAVVHLAAPGLTDRHPPPVRPWIEPTRLLAGAAATAGVPVFVSTSTVDLYGADRGDERLTEDSAPGDDAWAQLIRALEYAAAEGGGTAMRVVHVRAGTVQSPRGGVLRAQRRRYAAGLGGRVGSGGRWLAWIAIDDLVDVFHRALVDPRLSGPVNAVAPHPVRQREYAAALGRALRRPAVLPAPARRPTVSQRVIPAKLKGVGHRFRFSQLEPALRHLLGSTVPSGIG